MQWQTKIELPESGAIVSWILAQCNVHAPRAVCNRAQPSCQSNENVCSRCDLVALPSHNDNIRDVAAHTHCAALANFTQTVVK
jgi:hypothetical protein